MGTELQMSRGTIFARQVTVLSLAAVLGLAALAYVRGGWDSLNSGHFGSLFCVVIANLVVFGFFGKAG